MEKAGHSEGGQGLKLAVVPQKKKKVSYQVIEVCIIHLCAI
jgi:hypothetical protein